MRAPFVFEGMLLGLIGAGLPLIAVYFLYNRIVEYVTERFEILSSILKFLPVEEIFLTLVPASLILGVGIGFLGSFTSTRKHLKV